MKKLALFFAGTTAALAIVCLIQSRQLAAQHEQAAALNAQIEQASAERETLRASEKHAGDQVQDLLRQTEDLTAQLRARQPAETAPPGPPLPATPAGNQVEASGKPGGDKNGFGNFLSKMMTDPESRKFIRDQQRLTMDQLYTPLLKQLGLTPDESEKFKDLLADNMMKGAENASSVFGGTNQSASFTNLAAAQQTFDDEVKAFLGEERYAIYKDYQLTIGERAQLNQLKQMGGLETPLTDQQSDALLAIMKEEKAAMAGTTGQMFPGTGSDPASFQAMLSDDSVEKLLQNQGLINDRIYQRASQVLSPDQMAAFGKFQTNQLQMMRMGMSMARKFMTPDKSRE